MSARAWTLVVATLSIAIAACAPHARVPRGLPPPTEHRLDRDAERRNSEARRKWLEHMHRAGPDVDWRAIERANGRAEQERRNALGRAFGAPLGPANWSEVGSSNLAGRTHAAVVGPDQASLYVGSALGGVWRGGLDGTNWEPLGDNLFGGAHEVVVLPGEQVGEPDVLVVATDGGDLHVSRDEGLVWEAPTGIPDLWWIRGIGALADPGRTILFLGYGPGTSYRSTLFASTDYGRSFVVRWQGTTGWPGGLWVPRIGLGATNRVWILHDGKVWSSTNGGVTFPSVTTIAASADRGVLAGSEAGGTVLYAAFRVAGQWSLHRSQAGGVSWAQVHVINDFWETLGTSMFDANVVAYGGVEVYRSTNGGGSFAKLNDWWEYYDDPQTKLHADTPGLISWPDPQWPGADLWYVSTDGGTYRSQDGLSSVENVSLSGLAVSQYYSTLSDRTDWDRVSAGAQDQGYQSGVVQRGGGTGPTTPLAQLISGDYGHLTSGDGSHRLVFSTYPGFILVQDGAVDPALHFVDFPEGSLHAWLPPVVADPSDPEVFYFCADRLWRYDRTSTTEWSATVHASEIFGGPGTPGSYLSALAFAPGDPDRAYAVTDDGRLFWSTDHAASWTESTDSAPAQHYFYGNAIAVHPDNPLEVAVGGSGYSNPGVIRSIDGGLTWIDESSGLPPTMVYALTWAGDGDLFAGTETGAYRWNWSTGQWSNVMANEAPVTIYWSAETVNDRGTVRFGTYGRGIWDYTLVAGDRDGDGVPDTADLCGNDDDPAQADGDADSFGDACDNCPIQANPGQVDGDADGAGNVCDCSASNPGVFAIAPEIGGVRFTSATRLEWEPAWPLSGSSTLHVVYRGTLGEWPVGSSSNCMAVTLPDAQLDDFEIPVPGAGFWYLVRGANTCGQGSLGTWGSGEPQATPVCWN